jgi:hypothetical protein
MVEIDVVDSPLLEVAEQRLAIDTEFLRRLGAIPMAQLEDAQDVAPANLVDRELKLGWYEVGHLDHSMHESPAERPPMRRGR